MIELEQAWELLFDNVNLLSIEACAIEESVGRTVGTAVVAPIDVSPFRNTAMDGFAVRAEWLADCSESHPVTLPIGETVFAGDAGSTSSRDKVAIKVMTGAPMPEDFDAVVKVEDTLIDNGEVRFVSAAASGQHVRPSGEDVVKGQTLFKAGDRIGRLDIGILAGVGLEAIEVVRRPTVLMAGTGSELVAPGEPLGPGKIYDANSYTVDAMIEPWCASVECRRRIVDQSEALESVLDSKHDVIVTSGGVSMGERDLVVGTAESLGWKSIFHKARIKPGKPIFFARRGKQLLFGLPGNPLSTAVTCALFVIPVLKKMTGWPEYRFVPTPARLGESSLRQTGRRLIWPGMARVTEAGLVVEYANQKSSAALSALMHTDGLIIQAPVQSDTDEATISFISWKQILNS